MALSGKYVPIDTIIEKVYRDSGLTNVDWEAASEWAGELIGIMGLPNAYLKKSTNGLDNNPAPIEIENYRSVLPNDLISVDSCRRIEVNSSGEITGIYAMIESTDMFYETPTTNVQNTTLTITDPSFDTVEIDETGTINEITVTQDRGLVSSSRIYQYKLNANYIFTNFEEGYVEITYKGYAVDERGMPLIPADSKFQRAISADIIANIDKKRWRANPASPGLKAIYNDSAQERDWAVSSAMTKAKLPSVDQMEAIKNNWMRSISRLHEHANNFKTLNHPEIRYNQNS